MLLWFLQVVYNLLYLYGLRRINAFSYQFNPEDYAQHNVQEDQWILQDNHNESELRQSKIIRKCNLIKSQSMIEEQEEQEVYKDKQTEQDEQSFVQLIPQQEENIQMKKQINQSMKQQIQQIQQEFQQIQNLQKLQQKFNEEFKAEERQKQKIVYKDLQIKTKIHVEKDKIQLKVDLFSFLQAKQEKQSQENKEKKKKQKFKTKSQKTSFKRLQQYFQTKNVWQQLDQINKKDPSGQLTQMIYKQILNQKPTPQKIVQHAAIAQKLQQKSKQSNDSIQTAILCLAGYLQSVSDEIDVTFCQKSSLESKVTTKVLSTGFDMFKYKCQQKIQDGQTQWSFQQISSNPKQFQRFQKWYKDRVQNQYGIKDSNIRITAITKGSIRIQWDTTNPSQIAANPIAAQKIKIHPYFQHFTLCAQDFDPRGNIQFGSSKNDVQFRGNWPYYQPINCKRYGIKVWDLYDGGNNAWLTMNNSPGQWAVAYHGVHSPNNPSYNGKKVFNSIMDGRKQGKMFIKGGGQAYRANYSVNKNQLIGQGIYCSPHLPQALGYASGSLKINGNDYHLIFQCRVNPKKVHITPRQNYWVLNNPQDIRPYGIILMKSSVKSSYPNQNRQFNQSFTYQKYKEQIDKTQF